MTTVDVDTLSKRLTLYITDDVLTLPQNCLRVIQDDVFKRHGQTDPSVAMGGQCL